jgi:cytochrome c553
MKAMFVLAAVAAASVVCACAETETQLTQAELVERGEYLVSSVVLCGDCHTPRLENGEPDASRALQGAPTGSTPDVEMPWATIVPPIAGIPGHYTEEQFVSFLQTGVRPDGSHPLPPMPPYRLNDEDARAVAAYIATLPRAQN